MPLKEEDRRKLDGIVQSMISNKEPERNIKMVIDDFKAKYESQTEQPQITTEPESEGIKGDFTLKGVVSDAGERVKDRIDRFTAPTVLGTMATNTPAITKTLGAIGVSKSGVNEAFGAPERLTRAVAGVAGTAGEAVALPAEIAMKTLNKTLGGVPGELISKAVKFGIESKPGQKVLDAATKWWDSLHEADKANYGTLPDVMDLLGIKMPGKGSLPKGIADIKFKDAVEKGMSKAIKITPKGKKLYSSFTDKLDKSETAIKAILENKGNLVLESGKELPQNVKELSKAIEDTKSAIYKKYHRMAVESGENVGFDTSELYQEVQKLVIGKDRKRRSLEVRQHAEKRLDGLLELHGQPPEIVEDRIKELNKSMKAVFNTGTDRLHAETDVLIAGLLRKELDNNITSAVGPGYQDLKNQYGALLAIEEDVGKKAIELARKSPSALGGLVNAYSSGQIIAGLATGNVALATRGGFVAVAQKAGEIASDPNRNIKNMFKKIASSTNMKDKLTLQSPNVLPAIAKGITRGVLNKDDVDEFINRYKNK